MDWWVDLLITCTHHSELQVISAPSLISTIYKSPEHPLSLPTSLPCHKPLPGKASNSGDPSVSRPQVLPSSLPYRTELSTENWQQTGSSRVESNLMLRPTVSRPVWLGIKHPSGAYDQNFITVRQLRVCCCGTPLWQEDGSVVYSCCWPSPLQSFSDPSPVGLATIFYCLRFETSFIFASYDSQGYGGCIGSRLHTGLTGSEQSRAEQ
jgi:hypothetical protein